MQTRQALAGAVMIAVLVVSGCRVESNQRGDRKNVKVATPFGGMEVKTNDAKVVEGIGLPVYPGAELVKKKGKDGDNDGAADVNLSFGGFHLRVKAASYRTADGPEKVTEFYRKALGRYGDVIQCENNKPVGLPTHTAEGLTCDYEKKSYVSVDDEMPGKMELKAGSKQHMHVVAIDPEGNGTKLGLVALDLPGHFSINDGGDERQKQ